MRIRVVKTSEPAFKSLMARILQRRGSREGKVEKRVAEILRAVQKTGDRAVARYTELFDRVRLTRSTMEVKPSEIERAMKKVPAKDLLTLAAGGEKNRRVSPTPAAEELAVSRPDRNATRAKNHAVGTGRRLRPRR